MEYKNNYLKINKQEYESKFDDYRRIDEEEMEKHFNKNIGVLEVHQLLQQSSLNDSLWDFDAVS